jgi:hypothetical protein
VPSVTQNQADNVLQQTRYNPDIQNEDVASIRIRRGTDYGRATAASYGATAASNGVETSNITVYDNDTHAGIGTLSAGVQQQDTGTSSVNSREGDELPRTVSISAESRGVIDGNCVMADDGTTHRPERDISVKQTAFI